MDLSVQRIGSYDILGEVGRGNMGIVFRAFDPMIHRDVAIKVVKLPEDASAAQQEQYRQRILREIRSVGGSFAARPGSLTLRLRQLSGASPERGVRHRAC